MVHRGDERKAAAQANAPPRPTSRPDHRIGDAERQQAIDVLRAHTGAGRLTLDEFSDLAGAVYAAQTYAELEAVGRSLPPGLLAEPGGPQDAPVDDAPAPTPGGSADPAAGPTAGRGSRRQRFVAVMCGSNARVLASRVEDLGVRLLGRREPRLPVRRGGPAGRRERPGP